MTRFTSGKVFVLILAVVAGFLAGVVNASEDVALFPLGYEGGGRFTAVAVSPADPNIVLVGSDVCGVFKSVDGGETFHPVCSGLQEFAVADILFSPLDPDRVFLLTDAGLYLSRDRGENWEEKSRTVRYNSRRLGAHLMLFDKGALWVATDSSGVFRVIPEGRVWTVTEVEGLQGTQVCGLAQCGGGLYAATGRGVFALAGNRWEYACNDLDPEHILIENIIGLPSDRMYLVEHTRGVYAWDAKSRSWEHRGIGLIRGLLDRSKGFKGLGVDPKNPDELFLCTCPKTWPYLVYKSSDGGKSWSATKDFRLNPQASETFAKRLADPEKIAYSPGIPGTIFLTDWFNVWRSRDGGNVWEQVYRGLRNTVVNDIQAYPAGSSRLLAALSDNGLVESKDGGKTWKRKAAGLPDGDAVAVACSASDAEKIYLLMRPGNKNGKFNIFKSTDAGEHWNDVSFATPPELLKQPGLADGQPTNLILDPASDETVYLGTNGHGVFRSDNGGATWKAVNRGLFEPYIGGPGALAADPSVPGVLYASTLKGGIFRSADRGETWKSISARYPFTYGLALAPGNPSVIYSGCAEGKVLRSDDAGRTWKETLLPGVAPSVVTWSVAVDPGDPLRVVAGTMGLEYKASSGVFISRDGGKTFRAAAVAAGMPRVGVNRITFGPAGRGDGEFFVGLNGAGLYCGRFEKRLLKK